MDRCSKLRHALAQKFQQFFACGREVIEQQA